MTDLTMSQFASKDDLLAAQAARIAELEAELEAVGAGGVQRLAAAPQAVQAAVPEAIEQMAVDRYKVVPSHESMFHRWAVVAGNGTQQLYIGREVECQNMARKFMGAFLDGAFVAMQNASPAHPAEGVPAQAGAYAEARECEHCNHVGINDAANGIASCTACKWNGDSPKEDKCPDCEAEGTMTASCPKCHHEYRLIADATLAATQPAAQAMDAERLRNLLCRLVEQLEPRHQRRDGNAPGHGHTIPGVWDKGNGELAGRKCVWCEVWQEALEVHAAAQAKQEGAANG